MPYSKRVQTLQALIGGHPLLAVSPDLPAITSEAQRIKTWGRLTTDGGRLLAVLHTTRTLDTTLSALCISKSWPKPVSMGNALTTMKKQLVITEGDRVKYQQGIVATRNHYMHQAGAMPNRQVTDVLLSNTQTCLAHILAAI
jgi:hypothetical protein